MADSVIQIENLCKRYRLGVIGGKRLADDVSRQWARLRGKPDPLSKIGQHSHTKVNGKSGKAVNEIWALKDVSFDVKQGEVLGIIGRNGAGKSTLLKILSRVTSPTTGEVRVKGRIASLLEVGTGFHPELTGRENVFLNGAILGMTKTEIKKKFDEIIAFSEVEEFMDTPVKRYSSGMYVRLAFAVAAHLDPEILVVDEVLAVGDVAFQKKCLGKMGGVAREGRTVLFVSHNMAAVRSLCGSAVLLQKGQLTGQGNVDSVIGTYLQELPKPEKSNGEPLASNEDAGLVFEGLKLVDKNDNPVSVIQTGQPIEFRLHFQSSRDIRDVVAIIGVNSFVDDVRVCVFYSEMSGQQLTIPSGQTYLSCKIPKVPLVPGIYRLTLNIKSEDTTLFYMPAAIEVEVTAGDFFGARSIPQASWVGSSLVDHCWSSSDTR